MSESATLRAQVDDLQRDLSTAKETHGTRIHALTRLVDSVKLIGRFSFVLVKIYRQRCASEARRPASI